MNVNRVWKFSAGCLYPIWLGVAIGLGLVAIATLRKTVMARGGLYD